ncbi:APC family permease [Protaetiibacter intestinalis]|uniref:APC family permease n=1 Tax=Protaetiibacter intestinalis TaxID=2419774 RepID=A0A387B9C2_9MICO|nr:APC family permease [Protaetiibacter intestinalis]AYF97765.1 APC family permease [Protaetiibacter intestinalis]
MTTTTTRPAETAPQGDDAPERAVTGKLRGSLGVASIVFIVVAAASPLGVIGGPVPLGIAFGNGAGFPTIFLVVTAVLVLFAVGFTAATPYVRSAGAFYAYVDKGIGRGAGLGTAFSALLSYLVLEAGVFGLFGPGVDNLLQSYGLPAVPWWAYAAVGFVVVSALAYFNIELSGRVLAVLLIGEVLIVLALDAAVVFSGGGPEGFSTGFLDPAQIVSGAPGFAVLFALLSFIGFEATAVFRDEAKDPDKTIPRATYIALISIGVFYAISSWALISANGQSTIVENATANFGTILSDTTEQYLGAVGGHIIQVLFVTSLFACILSFHNISTRYFYSLARKGVIAKPLGIAHARHGSPSRASLVTATIVGLLVVAAVALNLKPIDEFYTWLGGIASVGFVLLLVITTASVIGIFRKEPHGVSLWRRLIAPTLALIGLLGFFAIILWNLPALVYEDSYGPFSIGILVLLALAFLAGPIVGRFRKGAELD